MCYSFSKHFFQNNKCNVKYHCDTAIIKGTGTFDFGLCPYHVGTGLTKPSGFALLQ
jgi:hypothetical protein